MDRKLCACGRGAPSWQGPPVALHSTYIVQGRTHAHRPDLLIYFLYLHYWTCTLLTLPCLLLTLFRLTELLIVQAH